MKKINITLFILLALGCIAFAILVYNNDSLSSNKDDDKEEQNNENDNNYEEVPATESIENGTTYKDSASGFQITLPEGWEEPAEMQNFKVGEEWTRIIRYYNSEKFIDIMISVNSEDSSGGIFEEYSRNEFNKNYIKVDNPQINMWISKNAYSYFDTTETVYGTNGDTNTVLFNVTLEDEINGSYYRSVNINNNVYSLKISNSMQQDLEETQLILRNIRIYPNE